MMILKNSFPQLASVSAALVMGVALTPAFSLQAVAMSQPARLNRSIPLTVSETFQPPDRGAPSSTADGGARGSCGRFKAGEKPLTALTPANYLPLTATEYPSFFWYIPESSAQSLEFTLWDEKDEQVIYKTKLPAPNKPGIMSFTLPAGISQPLKAGKMYHWYLVMVCDSEDRSGDTAVDGWIERTELSRTLTNELKNAAINDRPSIYAKAGIWHDSLSALAQLRRNNPDDLTIFSRWEEFLNSVELGQFAQEPLVEAGEISRE